MAEARRRDEYARHAALMAMVHNSNPFRKQADMKDPAYFNPYGRGKAARPEPAMKVSPRIFKGMLPKSR